MTEETKEWEFPKLTHGTRVIHYADDTKQDASLAFVVRPKNRSAALLVFFPNGGAEIRDDCWHVDDPVKFERPLAWAEAMDPSRGLFELAPAEIQAREMEGEIKQLRSDIEKLALLVHKRA